jgi:ribosomal protein S18 acetylase RimI-like enzyme
MMFMLQFLKLLFLLGLSQTINSFHLSPRTLPRFASFFLEEKTELQARSFHEEIKTYQTPSVALNTGDVKKLSFCDLPAIYSLSVKQFLSPNATIIESLNLQYQILYLFLPKFLFPVDVMGHYVLGLKEKSSGKLVAFVDLSLQQSCGSMNSLKSTTLSYRQKKISNLQPYMCNLLVDESYRRRGYAKLLLNACEQLAIAWGHREINLHVEASSVPACALYVKEGFEIKGALNNFTVLFMKKVF